MKIRIKGNSIRLRLSKTDIQQLREQGSVQERTVISADVVFSYTLEHRAAAAEMGASFSAGELTIWLPSHQALQLTESGQMGVQGFQQNGDNNPLFLLIEKDLQCLENTNEDQSDMYDNPKKSC